MADSEGISKNAKRRAAKKAREAEAAEPAPKTEVKPAAAPPASGGGYPQAKAKAKAEPKPAPEPKTKAQPKPEAKAKAQPKNEPAPKAAAKSKAEPKEAAQPKAQSKAKAKGKTEQKQTPKEVETPPKKEEDVNPFVEYDDGKGGDWEVASGLTKKQQKQKDRAEEAKKAAAAAGPQAVNNKYIPGMGPAVVNQIPGMAPQSVTAVPKNAKVADVAAQSKASEAAGSAAAAKEEAPKAEAFSATIKVPEDKIGIVIGPKGSKIKLIQEKTGVTRIDTSGDVFTIMGPADAVGMAELAIKDLITKGYTALAFEDFSENFVMVHPSTFPDLIGKQGAVIRAMKEHLNVEVSIPKTGPAGKKWKVTIAGKTQNVEKAKEVISDIQMYYHHEVTHPDETHEEMEVPGWAYSFIIGKGGSELRHIQNNYKVRVYIPREGVSTNENVVIVGSKHDVPRASAYIQKLLYSAQDVSKGRDRQDKADDGWGEEGPEEEWMKQYMYKRH